MRNKQNKTWMAACTLVVIVAFGSACTTTQTHQITPESFRTLQKDFEPAPTHVTKTTGTVLLLAKDFRNHLSILRNNHGTMEIDPGFSMTDMELRFKTKNTVRLDKKDGFSIEEINVPLDEISAYYLTEKQRDNPVMIGVVLGLGALFFASLAVISGLQKGLKNSGL